MPAAREKLDAFGLDAICDAILNTVSMTAIAESVGVSIGSLIAWIAADSERSARTREARTRTAQLWEEKAEDRLANATDQFSLSKAKELAHHYRWRASKIAPREYGERQTIDVNDVTPKTPEQVDKRIAELLAKASKPTGE